MAAIALAAIIVFIAGVSAGIIAVVIAGIRREDRDLTLTPQAADRVSRGARLLTGLYVREVAPAAAAEREATLV
jgi:hypothetical protein